MTLPRRLGGSAVLAAGAVLFSIGLVWAAASAASASFTSAARGGLAGAGEVFRVGGVVLLMGWAGWFRRSLTPMILVGMALGVEVGLDAPGSAVSLHFLSDIFLRLVKTIVSPLILVTLISGIAGHGDLKSVGRMGWKSLLYFEVLTTVAPWVRKTWR